MIETVQDSVVLFWLENVYLENGVLVMCNCLESALLSEFIVIVMTAKFNPRLLQVGYSRPLCHRLSATLMSLCLLMGLSLLISKCTHLFELRTTLLFVSHSYVLQTFRGSLCLENLLVFIAVLFDL